jgi:hypothetical protein
VAASFIKINLSLSNFREVALQEMNSNMESDEFDKELGVAIIPDEFHG